MNNSPALIESSAVDPASLDRHFPRYTDFDPAMPVWIITPNEGRAFHRFFDTSPISPSGRYLAFLRMPSEINRPAPGTQADVCLVDLQTGEDRTIAKTTGWDTQMGANINWGPDDTQLIFNDVDPDDWSAFAVNCNTATGDKRRLGGPVYHVSPDGLWAAASNPATMRRTQDGYGVVIPDQQVPRFVGPVDHDGLWLTNTQTGESRMLLSIKDAINRAEPAFELDDPSAYEIYGFHSKFSPDGQKLIFTLRFFPDTGEPKWGQLADKDSIRFTVLTLDLDAKQICNAVPTSRWRRGGHHINWYPDSQQLSMNLGSDAGLRLIRCGRDGSNLTPILPDTLGSGHPTVHPDGTHILTDVYANESLAYGDGTTPLRWINIQTGEERVICRMHSTQPKGVDTSLRIDPHPAWDRTWRWVTFNTFHGKTRRIFLADMQSLLDN